MVYVQNGPIPVHYILGLVIEKTTLNRLEPVCRITAQLFRSAETFRQAPPS